ncbi:MAG TPA: GNAT family N-acetyltransferase [Prolixibacteraceae bacterium]|nr:GNAT family N-acetyltransferase [Prolixibacteraceae bacterium]HPR84743.1 GNAT family N-acetyltransferase [Prolixibacteraceae bacterium]
MTTMKLELGKIRLRALEPEDIDILFEWENDTEIWEISNTCEPFSKYILAKYIKDSQRDIYESKQIRLVIETLDGVAVGAIDLFDFDPFHFRAGVGILIHNKNDRKLSYATDALELLCKYSLEYLRLHQLYANITEDNIASIHLFKKVGFALVGIKKDWRRTANGWKNELLFQKIL